MKILFFFFNPVIPEFGGVERVAACKMKEFMNLGHDVYTVYWNDININKSINSNYNNQYQLPDRSSINSLVNIEFLKKIIKEKQIDVVLNLGAINSRSSLGIIKACKIVNCPLISVIHNSIDAPLRYFSLGKRIMKTKLGYVFLRFLFKLLQYNPMYKGAYYVYKNTDATVVLSHGYINEFKYLIPKVRNSKKIFAISNPLTLIDDNCISEKENIVLFVGRLTTQKSVDKLLDIWNSLPNNNWSLVIVGSGNREAELKRKAKNMRSNVIFIGNCDPVPFYKRAKIFCLTSIYEGYPMTLIECQAFGCVPIIFNSFPAANEVITNDINGYVINAFDKKEYKEKLWKLMNDEQSLKQLSDNCMLESYKYSKDKIIKEWIILMENILRR